MILQGGLRLQGTLMLIGTNLTEEYSLILNETNCPDPFRVVALNIYRDIAKEKIK